MFEATFRRIDEVLRSTPECSSELDCIEQLSWLLLLKYLDAADAARATAAELENRRPIWIMDPHYRWSTWAMPRRADGSLDTNKALKGDALLAFVDGRLLPYLAGFKKRAASRQGIEYKIGGAFEEIRNLIKSGDALRALIELVDTLSFDTPEALAELAALHEVRLQRMGNSGRQGGELYTPRPLLRAMVKVLRPRMGDRVYDGALGTGGCLLETLTQLAQGKLTPKNLKILNTRTLYGREKRSLPYLLALLGLLFRGIENPNILHGHSLAESVAGLPEDERYDLVISDLPSTGTERKEVQQLSPLATNDTQLLFIQHSLANLKAGGRAALAVRSNFLGSPEPAAISLRKQLMRQHGLHTILDCGQCTFQGSPMRTAVLFLDKAEPNAGIWYYQIPAGPEPGKPNPLDDAMLAEFVEAQKTRAPSAHSRMIGAEIWAGSGC